MSVILLSTYLINVRVQDTIDTAFVKKKKYIKSNTIKIQLSTQYLLRYLLSYKRDSLLTKTDVIL